jgi:predicted O-methyltransferase YrrM
LRKKIIRFIQRIKGDVFQNPGPITDEDFEIIRQGIEEVKPLLLIEIGTGRGISTRKIAHYLRNNNPKCHFYTIDI